MKAVRGIASVALVIAWLVFMFAGYRSNALLRDTQTRPLSYCQSHPSEFQSVDLKGPACLNSSAAQTWKGNQRLLKMAGVIGAVLFIALLAEQWLRRQRDARS
jgi:hypothetical protein